MTISKHKKRTLELLGLCLVEFLFEQSYLSTNMIVSDIMLILLCFAVFKVLICITLLYMLSDDYIGDYTYTSYSSFGQIMFILPLVCII